VVWNLNFVVIRFVLRGVRFFATYFLFLFLYIYICLLSFAVLGGREPILWGASFVTKSAGIPHGIHTDAESSDPEGGYVGLWIPVSGTDNGQDSGMHFFAGSHTCPPFQAVHAKTGIRLAQLGSGDIATRARNIQVYVAEHCPGARSIARTAVLNVRHGEMITMDGRMWHGTHNNSSSIRIALLLQYASEEKAVRKLQRGSYTFPFQVDYCAEWPVALLRSEPSLAVNNEDERVNDLVDISQIIANKSAPVLKRTAPMLSKTGKCTGDIPWYSGRELQLEAAEDFNHLCDDICTIGMVCTYVSTEETCDFSCSDGFTLSWDAESCVPLPCHGMVCPEYAHCSPASDGSCQATCMQGFEPHAGGICAAVSSSVKNEGCQRECPAFASCLMNHATGECEFICTVGYQNVDGNCLRDRCSDECPPGAWCWIDKGGECNLACPPGNMAFDEKKLECRDII
jgi:hypothetical protein